MIYITGDIHGDLGDIESRSISKIKKGDILIVTGDFGFLWDNSKSELKSLKKLSKKKFTILFVEGVHENFDMINEHEEIELYGNFAKKITDNIYCLKRGVVYTIEGKSVFTLGGGTVDDPIEKADSDPLNDKAIPTDKELQEAVNNLQGIGKKVDIIITHEAPASVKRLIRRDSSINDLNIFFDTLLHNVKYKMWYFGSLHTDRALSTNMTCVWQNVIKVDI
ncbi:MAG: metallophosphoesterase [Ruminococcus sp.]|nr:metallophosphoesterase [Ruminococcus sp.]